MRALYILSDSRSGSTLLQYLLSLQKEIVALGEVRRLEQFVDCGGKCACGRPVNECPFWREIASRVGKPLEEIKTFLPLRLYRRRFGQVISWTALKLGLEVPARRLLAYERLVVADCLSIYRAAAELTGSHCVVDSSKVPSQFLHLYMGDKTLVQPIFLARDGRGVTCSKLQRSRQRGNKPLVAEQAARQWHDVNRAILTIQKVLPTSQRNFVHYEELCKRPPEILQGLLTQAGLRTQSIDLGSLAIESHHLGGSPHFRDSVPDRIELDEKWKTESSEETLATFEKLAGPLNRRLGYIYEPR